MKVNDLTESERKVWEAAATGTLVDLRVGNSDLDSPEKWSDWAPERVVRSEVIVAMLIGDGEVDSTAVRGVRLQGARIAGDLNLEATTLRCPLALLDCSFANAINLNEAKAISICLSGSHVPTIRARQLRTSGDLCLNNGFRVEGGVELTIACIGGQFDCTGGQFSNTDGPAIKANGLTAERGMFCNDGFSATGEVRLVGAYIGYGLNCRGGQFSNPDANALSALALTVDGVILFDFGFSATGAVDLGNIHTGALYCNGGQFSNPGKTALNASGLTIDHDMYCGNGFSATGKVSLMGTHIGGILDCGGGQFSNPDGVALDAGMLTVDQAMYCDNGFSANGEVRLDGAHITSNLDCNGGQFSNPGKTALNASGLTVDHDMYCNDGFSATGKVSLVGTHIGGILNCAGGHFSNPDGVALNALLLTVGQDMFFGDNTSATSEVKDRFSATGEVNLQAAHIGAALQCNGGQFSNPDGVALNASGLTVGQHMSCSNGFSANGEVRLDGAHITSDLYCHGGQFSNPGKTALNASGLTVDRDMLLCTEFSATGAVKLLDALFVGFSATGAVKLLGAYIGGQLNCMGGQFSNPNGLALDLERATVGGPLHMKPARLEGTLDLTAAKTSSYHDNPASWPEKLRLDRFVYDAIDGSSVKERCKWLCRNEKGYSPQIYEQLAATFHRAGHDGGARRILIKKQRLQTAQVKPAYNRIWGFLFDWTVGYGYHTGRALLWLVGLLALGTVLFGYVFVGDLASASDKTSPPFQPFLYTLDLLLPVASLHQRDGWVAHGAAQWLSAIFIIMGWILATAVVASLTGLLKRDLK